MVTALAMKAVKPVGLVRELPFTAPKGQGKSGKFQLQSIAKPRMLFTIKTVERSAEFLKKVIRVKLKGN